MSIFINGKISKIELPTDGKLSMGDANNSNIYYDGTDLNINLGPSGIAPGFPYGGGIGVGPSSFINLSGGFRLNPYFDPSLTPEGTGGLYMYVNEYNDLVTKIEDNDWYISRYIGDDFMHFAHDRRIEMMGYDSWLQRLPETQAVVGGDKSGTDRGDFSLDIQSGRYFDGFTAEGNFATCIGLNCLAYGQDGVAIGSAAWAHHQGAVSIGSFLESYGDENVNIGTKNDLRSPYIIYGYIPTYLYSTISASAPLSTLTGEYSFPSPIPSAGDFEVSGDAIDLDPSGSANLIVGNNCFMRGIQSTALGSNLIVSADNSTAIGRNVRTYVDNTLEFGRWTDSTREAGLRIHPNGQIATTFLTTSAAPTDGGALDGYEEDGTIPRGMYTIQKVFDDITLYYNTISGDVQYAVVGSTDPTRLVSYLPSVSAWDFTPTAPNIWEKVLLPTTPKTVKNWAITDIGTPSGDLRYQFQGQIPKNHTVDATISFSSSSNGETLEIAMSNGDPTLSGTDLGQYDHLEEGVYNQSFAKNLDQKYNMNILGWFNTNPDDVIAVWIKTSGGSTITFHSASIRIVEVI